MNLRQNPDGSYSAPRRGRPPPCPEGFVRDRADSFRFYRVSGFGDTLQRALGKLAFWKAKQPCPGCDQRKEWLNDKIPYEWKLTSEESLILYQALYDDKNLNYGNAHMERCPGTGFYPHYKDWLVNPIIDLGCGRGHTVELMVKDGYKATGIDQIECHPDMLVGDITSKMDLASWTTALCIDVFEHLYDEQLDTVMLNMQVCDYQIISVANMETSEHGFGVNLHVNIKSMEEWYDLLNRYFVVKDEYIRGPNRKLFYCERRK